jgi:O-methyltransferase involved in polyketide biosynthesis
VVFQWRSFLDYLPPKKTDSVVSKLQDQFDKGELTPQEYFDQWDAEMEENERLHPGIHDRLFEKLMAMYPGSRY